MCMATPEEIEFLKTWAELQPAKSFALDRN
jgi:hypothetical protein